MSTCACTRRDFLGGSCGAWVTLALGALPAVATRRVFASADHGETVITRPFGRVERIADGVYAVIATTQGGNALVSNGGIIVGRDAVLAVEAHMTEEGSRFVRDVARELTGRAPTHVVVTHCHGDHTAGLAAYLDGDRARLIASPTTRDLLYERSARARRPGDGAESNLDTGPPCVLPDTILRSEEQPTELDLGGRTVRLVPRVGHTPSDVTIEIDEPKVVWCGDLVFNRLFPYYGDAIPSELGKTCNAMLRDPDTIYVPGHGPLADSVELEPYRELLENVGDAAREAFAKGIPPAEAWKTYRIPARLGDWSKFREDVTRFAFEAWARELAG